MGYYEAGHMMYLNTPSRVALKADLAHFIQSSVPPNNLVKPPVPGANFAVRLLDRYLLRELLVPLGYCLGGFLVFYIAFDLIFQINRFLDAHLLFWDIVEYYVVTLPELLWSRCCRCRCCWPCSMRRPITAATTN
jgi:hypothetical protein